jgi:hypothetical protein
MLQAHHIPALLMDPRVLDNPDALTAGEPSRLDQHMRNRRLKPLRASRHAPRLNSPRRTIARSAADLLNARAPQPRADPRGPTRWCAHAGENGEDDHQPSHADQHRANPSSHRQRDRRPHTAHPTARQSRRQTITPQGDAPAKPDSTYQNAPADAGCLPRVLDTAVVARAGMARDPVSLEDTRARQLCAQVRSARASAQR